MNRRKFLGLAAVAPVAAVLPVTAETPKSPVQAPEVHDPLPPGRHEVRVVNIIHNPSPEGERMIIEMMARNGETFKQILRL